MRQGSKTAGGPLLTNYLHAPREQQVTRMNAIASRPATSPGPTTHRRAAPGDKPLRFVETCSNQAGKGLRGRHASQTAAALLRRATEARLTALVSRLRSDRRRTTASGAARTESVKTQRFLLHSVRSLSCYVVGSSIATRGRPPRASGKGGHNATHIFFAEHGSNHVTGNSVGAGMSESNGNPALDWAAAPTLAFRV